MREQLYHPGRGTMRNLIGVHPDLVSLVMLQFAVTKQDVCIIDAGGVRSQEEALENAEKGTGIPESLHIPQKSGWGEAVDLVPYEKGKGPSWEKSLFPETWCAWRYASAVLHIPTQIGADWNVNGVMGELRETDYPHRQLAAPHRLQAAKVQIAEDRMIISQAQSADIWSQYEHFRFCVLPSLVSILSA